MAEILTESFCERCGTRYTFEVAAPRSTRVGRLRLLSKGLRNYVMHDESSLGDAFAAAESDEDRERASQQLDAFHKTFNFCMSCRQYTCGNCWNEAEGRCLTCAPQLGREILPAFVGSDGYVPEQPTTALEQPTIAASAWPTVDLPSQPEPIEPVALVEPATAVEPEPRAQTPEPTLLEPAFAAQAPAEQVAPEPVRPAAEIAPIEVAAAAESVAAETATPVEPAEPLQPSLAPAAMASAQVDQAEAVAPPAPVVAAPEALSDVAAVAEAALEPAPSSPESEELPPEVAAARGASQTHGLFARFRPGHAAEPMEQIAPTPFDSALLTGAPDTAEAAASSDIPGGQVPVAELAPEVTADHPGAEPPAGEQALAGARPAATAEPAPTEPKPVEPEPAIAASAAPAEPAPTEPEPAPVEQPPARPPVDIVAQPVWSRVAPETVPTPEAPSSAPPAPAVPTPPPAAVAPSAIAPQTGSAPAWPSPLGSAPAWPPAPPPAPTGVQWPQAAAPTETVWAESSRDVLNRPGSGVQACVSCGLPLSATARFCRRCGSRQG